MLDIKGVRQVVSHSTAFAMFYSEKEAAKFSKELKAEFRKLDKRKRCIRVDRVKVEISILAKRTAGY